MGIKPSSKPQQSREKTIEILTSKGVDISKPCMLGVRGYYRDTMGVPGKNDFNLYDDACFFVSPTAYVSWNFNVDPVRSRPGHGFGSEKGMGHLKPGVWKYQPGIHRGYQAFVQAGPVTVYRDADKYVPSKDIIIYDGSKYYENTGWFGVNLHRGGTNTTSSIACNTWPVDQFDGARALIYSELKRHGAKKFEYCLV